MRNSVSVVIPTLGRNPKTLESIPDEVETLVINEGNKSEARNKGAREASGDLLLFCDDDISFSEEFLVDCLDRKWRGEHEIVGLEDYDFELLLTRFLLISKEAFFDIGGFDGRLNTMEDTDFCLRATKKGYVLKALPMNSVHHVEHPSRIGKWERRRHLLKLIAKHKTMFLFKVVKLVWRKLWRKSA